MLEKWGKFFETRLWSFQYLERTETLKGHQYYILFVRQGYMQTRSQTNQKKERKLLVLSVF